MITYKDKDDQRPTTAPTQPDNDLEQVFCDNIYSKQSVDSIKEFNKKSQEIIAANFESTMKKLDQIQYKFTEQDLKKTLNTQEEFEQLKAARKKITQFHTACNPSINSPNSNYTTSWWCLHCQADMASLTLTVIRLCVCVGS